MAKSKWTTMVGLTSKTTIAFFLMIFSCLIFFTSGVIESIDEWLYISVTRNIYYNQSLEAAPKEYDERKNVYFNSVRREDGTWYSRSSLGYSLALLPSVFLSDIYQKVNDLPVSQHFPLETTWSQHLFASFNHVFWGAVLASIILIFLRTLGSGKKESLLLAGGSFFLSNLFPASNHSYPHIFQTCVFMLILVLVNLYTKTKIKWHLVLGILLTTLALPIAYNYSFFLFLPGIVLYFLLKNGFISLELKSLKKLSIVFLTLALGLTPIIYLFNLDFVITSIFLNFKPVIFFEGVWGLLFSAGKSVFLYNPLLVILVVFWWKIPKKYYPELAVFLMTAALFAFFYGQSYMMDKTTIVPIWAGGNSWGVRYLIPLLPLGMILSFLTAKKLSKVSRKVVVYPLILIAAWVQIIGISLPYDLQYGSLPSTVTILDGYHDRYSYASHIPRFSPLVTQSRYFVKRLIELPATLSNEPFEARLYDGFSTSAQLGVGTVRSFGEGGGYASFIMENDGKISLSTNLIGIIDRRYATPSASLVVNGKTIIENFELSHNQINTLETNIYVSEGENFINFLLECNDNCGNQTALLQELKLDGQPVNLNSIDLPYVDHGTENQPDRKYYGTNTNYWKLWNLRHNIFVSTLDFWWLRYLYYWDLPKKFIIGLLATNCLIFYLSARHIYVEISHEK